MKQTRRSFFGRALGALLTLPTILTLDKLTKSNKVSGQFYKSSNQYYMSLDGCNWIESSFVKNLPFNLSCWYRTSPDDKSVIYSRYENGVEVETKKMPI